MRIERCRGGSQESAKELVIVGVAGRIRVPVAVGAPIERDVPVARFKVEAAIGVSTNPVFAARVGSAAVLRHIESILTVGGIVGGRADVPLGRDVVDGNDPAIALAGRFEIAEIRASVDRFDRESLSGEVSGVAGVAGIAYRADVEMILSTRGKSVDVGGGVGDNHVLSAASSGHKRQMGVFDDVFRGVAAPGERDRHSVDGISNKALRRVAGLVREVEAIEAVGVGPVGGRDVSGVAFGVVGSHMILVDDPNVGFVDTHALLVVAGGRERRVARRVDDLDVAIFMQLHLPAKKRGARRGDVGLKSELDNHHAVGG